MCSPRPHRPDVAGATGERDLQGGNVELRIVSQDGDDGALVDILSLQPPVGLIDDHVICF